MTIALGLAALAVALFGPAGPLLSRSAWPSRAPRAAVFLWQAIGLAGALAAIGAGVAVTVAPLHAGLLGGALHLARQAHAGHPFAGLGMDGSLGLTMATDIAAVLLVVIVVATIRTARVRAQHRRVLDLVSARSERAPGASLLIDFRAAAYYLPGVRPRIVVSAGTLEILDNDRLSAVLAHERGHARERHGTVLLPFTAMDGVLHFVPFVRHARREVAALLEMAADDYATRRVDRCTLAAALVAMSTTSASPSCTFAASTTGVVARVHRLVDPTTPSRIIAASAVCIATFVLALPLAVGFIS
jgi:Zn-dependent protease with chaperone function